MGSTDGLRDDVMTDGPLPAVLPFPNTANSSAQQNLSLPTLPVHTDHESIVPSGAVGTKNAFASVKAIPGGVGYGFENTEGFGRI